MSQTIIWLHHRHRSQVATKIRPQQPIVNTHSEQGHISENIWIIRLSESDLINSGEFIFIYIKSLDSMLSNALCSEGNSITSCVQTLERHGSLKNQTDSKVTFLWLCFRGTSFRPRFSQQNIKGKLEFYANTTFSNSGNGHAAVKYFSLGTNIIITCCSAHIYLLSCTTKQVPVFPKNVLNKIRESVEV
jgi:hypothetical protein